MKVYGIPAYKFPVMDDLRSLFTSMTPEFKSTQSSFTFLMRLALLTVILFSCVSLTPSIADEISFTRDIQPIFAEKCFNCHGPDKAEAGLQLHDSRKAIAELDSGDFAVVPGDLENSTLIARILSSDESEKMPPEGDPLTKEQISKIQKWIKAGAKYDQHWAYVPVQLSKLPNVNNKAWVKNEIDSFVLEYLEERNVKPSESAAKPILVKRLFYDLIGLPPTPEEVDQYVKSVDPNAYETLVDRLLASKHFGERWGRHWLDKARYADSDGYEKDRPRLNAWRYRDWVIDAVNRDIPFDQFTIEQLAGDLLPESTAFQKLATAFHRQTLTNTEGGTDQEQFRVEATFDRTETVGAIWMGLTLTCARCHSHKYDQISQREYFRMYSFFNSANETNTTVPKSNEDLRKYEEQLTSYRAKQKKLENELDSAIKKIGPDVDKWVKEQKAIIAKSVPAELHGVKTYRSSTSSGAKIEFNDSVGSVTGKIGNKDKYTLFIESSLKNVTGLRLDVLTDKKLPGRGPGRAPNGNFVLSEIRAYTSVQKDFKKFEKIQLANAEADFAQRNFSPSGALSEKPRSGWAISPQMGKPHWLVVHFKNPVDLGKKKFLQVVLDQQYGGQHLIGKFRIRLMTGYNPLKSLPTEVVQALQSDKFDQKQRAVVERFVTRTHAQTKELWKKLESLKKSKPSRPEMSVRVMASAKRQTNVLHRGDFLQPGDKVQAGVLSVVDRNHTLKNPTNEGQPDRLAFANWLVDPNHPLTARVTVNHVWAHLFGNGIVSTLNDFGVRGELPTHPELLDWLAWKFSRDLKWSRKALIKKIVMSATYRQASRHRPELAEIDPSNRWLARQNRVRVPAETVRDLYLAASGLLSRKIGGPSVFPPLPSGVADLSYANNFKWKTSQGEDRYRRGMYTFFKRTSPHPNLISFDCPDSNTTKIKREQSNTPIQALVTLNNEVYLESAQAMAKRLIEKEFQDNHERLRYAMRLCIARDPSEKEVLRFQKLYLHYFIFYRNNEELAKKLVSKHATDKVSIGVNAAWVATFRIVMNLDEFIVRD